MLHAVFKRADSSYATFQFEPSATVAEISEQFRMAFDRTVSFYGLQTDKPEDAVTIAKEVEASGNFTFRYLAPAA